MRAVRRKLEPMSSTEMSALLMDGEAGDPRSDDGQPLEMMCDETAGSDGLPASTRKQDGPRAGQPLTLGTSAAVSALRSADHVSSAPPAGAPRTLQLRSGAAAVVPPQPLHLGASAPHAP